MQRETNPPVTWQATRSSYIREYGNGRHNWASDLVLVRPVTKPV
jgi:hypothetical protein